MKLSLTSARPYPTALISREVCPGCPPAVAETVPFRLCRRSSGTGATDSAPNGEIRTGRPRCRALFLNFVLLATYIDEEHDALQTTLYFRAADIIRIHRRRVYLCRCFPRLTRLTHAPWSHGSSRLSPNSRRCTSEHMYKYDPASKKIRYVLESDVRVLSILSMSKRVLLHMHEPVDKTYLIPSSPTCAYEC